MTDAPKPIPVSASHQQLERTLDGSRMAGSALNQHYSSRGKDFKAAYNKLAKDMIEKDQDKAATLLTEQDIEEINHIDQIDRAEFFQRMDQFERIKQIKIKNAQYEANKMPDECTFTPSVNMKSTRTLREEPRQRDLHEFLSDQQRFLEVKHLKQYNQER